MHKTSPRDEKLNRIFDLEPIVYANTQNAIAINDTDNKESIDIVNVKKVHYDLLKQSQDALTELIEFAKSSESPRAYEVVANLIKTTADVAKNLVEISIKGQKNNPENQTNTQTNIFCGTTADLQKIFKGMREDV